MRNPFRQRDYERYAGPGFVMERDGRVVRTRSTLDADGHAEMRRRLATSVDEIKGSLSSQVADLYAILHQYRPEDVLGALWFRNARYGSAAAPNAAVRDDTANLAFVEYVATLYVRDRGAGEDPVVPPHVVDDIQQRVQHLSQHTMWLWMAQDAARHGSQEVDAARELWFMTLMESLVVRYPGHFDHMKEALLGIEAEMGSDLDQWLGWNMADAVAVGDTIITLLDERLNANLARGAAEAARMREAAWPRGRHGLAGIVKRFLPPERRPWNRRAVYGLTAWVHFLMQNATTFTVDELARTARVPSHRVAALLKAASLPWGSCQEEFFANPHPTPPILTTPCIECGDYIYLVPVPLSFTWAIRRIVEDTLKAREASGQTHCSTAYERARARFTERETLKLFAKAFRHADVFRALKYSWVKDGETIQGELDGLVLADDTAVLVEVKAGVLSPAVRRGAPDRLREQLRDLVGEAHQQALKAREFMRSAPTVVFEVEGGTPLRVHPEKLNAFVLVTVSLDPLEIFTTNMNRLVEVGAVAPGDLPWAVSYLDLVVIADALEFPAQMLHYLKRRQRINELGFVMAHDELDWYGHYLTEGLFFERLAESAAKSNGKFVWNIIGYSKELDAHYMHDERCSGGQPPIPRQPMPESMREMLRELEESRPRGYLQLSLALLDLSWQGRKDFFDAAEDLIRRARADCKAHDFTMILEDDQGGLTFMAGVERDRLRKDLHVYCQLKKYQCRCTEWVGIGTLVDSDAWVDEAIIIRGPWEPDDELERLVAASLPPLPNTPRDPAHATVQGRR